MRISVLCGKPKKGVSSIDCRIIVTTFIDERCSFVCFFFAIITCFASKTADYLFFCFKRLVSHSIGCLVRSTSVGVTTHRIRVIWVALVSIYITVSILSWNHSSNERDGRFFNSSDKKKQKKNEFFTPNPKRRPLGSRPTALGKASAETNGVSVPKAPRPISVLR